VFEEEKYIHRNLDCLKDREFLKERSRINPDLERQMIRILSLFL
jgi:hypothetical protein